MLDFVANCAGISTVIGSGDYVISAGTTKHRNMVDVLTDGQEVSYYVTPRESLVAGYETGTAVWDVPSSSLVVQSVLTSSNSNAKVSWTVGEKVVYITASTLMLTDATQLVTGTLPYARVPIGTAANTVAAGNDSRFGAVDYGDLPAAAALDRTEIVAIDQGGDGVQTTVGDILDANMYGGLIAASNAVAEGTVGAFPAIRIVQAWTANDLSNFIVPDYTAGTLTVPTGGDGAYFITANIYTYTGSNSKTYTFGIFKNTGPFGIRACSQLTSGSGAGSNLSMSGVIDLVAGDVISLYVLSTDGGTAMTVAGGDIFMQRMGA